MDKLHLPGGGNRIQRYGFVLLLVCLFFAIKTALTAVLGTYVPFLFSSFIVILSAWFGGFGPGVLATLLTGAIIYFVFLEPVLSFGGSDDIQNVVIIVIFCIQGFIISMLSESHRKSDTQKSEFIGIISHELKSPLASIKGFAELIKRNAEKKHDKKITDYSKTIDSQVGHLTEMINEMLDITTIETGRLTYHDEKFNIHDLVKEVITNQQVHTDTHKIVMAGKATKRIEGDRYRIGQVINNLISNAVKYSQNTKKAKVIVRVKQYTGGVEIQVQDFGPGISFADQKNIFKPFFRAKKTEGAKGTGIGLYISYQIVQRHNGEIWCESTQGKGTLFCVRLPSRRS